MNIRPFELWLIWQNTETRQRYHVGNLIHEDGVYKFGYENGGRRKLSEAMQNGYKPHLAFPETDRTYVSNRLFGPFSRRLPDKRRPDFSDLLQELGLSADYTEMDLLRATGGRLATDAYEFVHPLYVENNTFNFDFYIAGWRYYDGDHVINHLNPGDTVEFKPHYGNPEDDKAVAIVTDSGLKLGYIPAFYSGLMFEVIENNCVFFAKIDGINPYAVPQRKVNITVKGKLNDSFNMNHVFSSNDELQLIKQ